MQPQTRSVYLAGPITGLTHDEARHGWRKEFASLLPEHIEAYSPMRAKEFLADHGVLSSDPATYPENAMASPGGILTRDTNDVRTCDVMVACFLESGGRLSAGTMIELGMAHILAKPVVMVAMPDDPNRTHVMAQRIAGYHVETLDEAAYLVVHLLTPVL